MTQEEKAKAYDEALEKAKKLYEKGTITESIGYIFPKLAESEDEKIRKWLEEHIEAMPDNSIEFKDVKRIDVLHWLEKQGNQKPQGKSALDAANEEKVDNQNCVKPSDKVEPKFHEGEWIVLQDKCCKVNYNGCGYELIDQMGLRTSLEYGTVDENAHIWNIIKDAEDGDVLVYGDNPNDYHVEVIMIFKSLRNKHSAFTHFHIFDDEFRTDDWCDCGENAHPATKEQRDALMKAMADAGYTFDFEKKELKEIEFNADELIEASYQQQADDLIDMVTEKSTWSEDDERMMLSIEQVMNCASLLNIVPQKINKVRTWLKSIKERIE